MKKLIFTLFAALISLNVTAQAATDTYTVNTKDGQSKTLKINQFPKLQFNADATFGNYMQGMEGFGQIDTWKVDEVSNVIFNVYHESDVSNITLADKAALDNTKRLYKYLKMNYGSKIFSSVMANVNWNHQEADKIQQATGKYPAINCYDFIQIYVPKNNWINYDDITPVTEWAGAGGIVSLMWHFNVPTAEGVVPGTDGSGVTCSTDKTTFKASNALKSGTWEYRWFYQQMDKVAAVLQKLQDADIVALWRPFHEGAGNSMHKTPASWATAWFWWGADGAETYKSLWRTMFNYFQEKGIHNLIWTWTTQNYNGDSSQYNDDSDFYPGNEYVDIIGRDLYGTAAKANQTEFQEISSRHEGKMVALAECGRNGQTPFANISDVWQSGAKWLYFMPWYGESMPDNSWWKDAMSQSYVITRDQVNLQATTNNESAKDAVRNMGLGWSLGNTLDANGIGKGKTISQYETCWGQPVTTQAMMNFLKQGGLNCVRVPVTWYEHMDADGNVDEAWMNRVQEVVDYVINAGMYCILNVHHDTAAGAGAWIKADAGNYTANKARFEKLWTQIANRFAGYDQHLLFEGYNEMLDADNTWNAPKNAGSYAPLNSYAQSFVNTVRATGGNNSTRNLIVNTYAGAHGTEVLNNFKVPADKTEGHLAVQVHTYDPYNWIKTYGEWNTICSNTIKEMFSELNRRFVSQGVPVIIGEYGTHGDGVQVEGSSTDKLKQAAADQATDMIRQAKPLGIATIYWSSIFYGSDRTVPKWTLPTVVAAMKQAYNE